MAYVPPHKRRQQEAEAARAAAAPAPAPARSSRREDETATTSNRSSRFGHRDHASHDSDRDRDRDRDYRDHREPREQRESRDHHHHDGDRDRPARGGGYSGGGSRFVRADDHREGSSTGTQSRFGHHSGSSRFQDDDYRDSNPRYNDSEEGTADAPDGDHAGGGRFRDDDYQDSNPRYHDERETGGRGRDTGGRYHDRDTGGRDRDTGGRDRGTGGRDRDTGGRDRDTGGRPGNRFRNDDYRDGERGSGYPRRHDDYHDRSNSRFNNHRDGGDGKRDTRFDSLFKSQRVHRCDPMATRNCLHGGAMDGYDMFVRSERPAEGWDFEAVLDACKSLELPFRHVIRQSGVERLDVYTTNERREEVVRFLEDKMKGVKVARVPSKRPPPFVGTCIKPDDEEWYIGAGLLPYRQRDHGIEVLLAVEFKLDEGKVLFPLGDHRVRSKTVIESAVALSFERAANVFPEESAGKLVALLESTCVPDESDAKCDPGRFAFPPPKPFLISCDDYACFVFNADGLIPDSAPEEYEKHLAELPAEDTQIDAHDPANSDVLALRWVPAASLFRSSGEGLEFPEGEMFRGWTRLKFDCAAYPEPQSLAAILHSL